MWASVQGSRSVDLDIPFGSVKTGPASSVERKVGKLQGDASLAVVEEQTALDLTKYASIQGKKMFTEPTNAVFSLSHNVGRHLASLSVLGNGIPTPQPTVREKALCVPENPNTSMGNQGQIKMYIDEVCPETVLRCCKSFLQQAGLDLLISMTVINNMLAKSVSDPKFPLISQGSECAQVEGLEALMGLPEKPVLAGEVLAAQMLSSSMLPFIRSGSREVLLEALSP
ncbi:protein ARMCX6-like [Peromyscus eremicus]|uniref:protein ARMCX6-like n=1 Tax=Peromyscus eremicus TaxID=42410 RepID=UPI0027DBA756|nr:protein ARMCX6-like [Peromyscus eremicus]